MRRVRGPCCRRAPNADMNDINVPGERPQRKRPRDAGPRRRCRELCYEWLRRCAVAGALAAAGEPSAHAPHVPNVPPSIVFADFQHCPFCFTAPPMEFSAEAGTAAMSAATAAAAMVKRMTASPWIFLGGPLPVDSRYKSAIGYLYQPYSLCKIAHGVLRVRASIGSSEAPATSLPRRRARSRRARQCAAQLRTLT